MEANEIMNETVNNEVMEEITPEVVPTNSGNSFMKNAVIGGAIVLGGVLIYKYAIKPAMAKRKAEKEKAEAEENSDNSDDSFIEVEAEVNETK